MKCRRCGKLSFISPCRKCIDEISAELERDKNWLEKMKKKFSK
jgi:ribosomal protein L37E